MKRYFLFIFIFVSFLFALSAVSVRAQDKVKVDLPVRACPLGTCPSDLIDLYKDRGEACVDTFAKFQESPTTNHFWIEDPEITSQGKADERARQFLYWVFNRTSIEDHPVLKSIWNVARNIAYFMVIFMAAIMGIGFIIGQRTNFKLNIEVWPSVFRIGGALLYITFSAAIVITLIQLSEVLMKFFAENLGGKDLFNIYFSSISQETNYLNFIGCRDLNYKVQEGINAELFLLKLTNITYYTMGVMVLLRKIILWFMLFVSPFLAILFSFVLIRNVGWIWVGVFFQWLFYGPLFALFLGALATIWKNKIPFNFDFSRIKLPEGYVYPTGINIVYGGPTQELGTLNSGNYVDTFAEYIITLIMLWAVTFFPWWLLRIFRDYCCDAINAMKNILLSMYDQTRGGPSPTPGPSISPTTIGTALKIPREVEVSVKTKLETIEEIKKAKTEEITQSMNLKATKLTDIAHFETNKQVRETVTQNLNYLKNPTQATTPNERQKYMNIRTELFTRAVKQDSTAASLLSSISSSKIEQIKQRDDFLRYTPKVVPVTSVVSVKVKMPQEKVRSLTSSYISTLSTKTNVLGAIAQSTQLQSAQVQTVLSALGQNLDQPTTSILQKLAESTSLTKEQVASILKLLAEKLKTQKDIAQTVAQKEQVKEEDIEQVISSQLPLIAEADKNVEQAISVPPTVSIEEYEEVKKMWARQYEKGEVPVTENITSRAQWVEQDIVLITNTLNKLLAADEKLRQQGLDDVGYILPIFLINNLKAEELMIYLKAKLEAAKQVQTLAQKEKEVAEKLKAASAEELVEVAATQKKEEAKTMEMGQELDPNKQVQ